MELRCPVCGSTDIEYDETRAAYICRRCGTVIGEHAGYNEAVFTHITHSRKNVYTYLKFRRFRVREDVRFWIFDSKAENIVRRVKNINRLYFNTKNMIWLRRKMATSGYIVEPNKKVNMKVVIDYDKEEAVLYVRTVPSDEVLAPKIVGRWVDDKTFTIEEMVFVGGRKVEKKVHKVEFAWPIVDEKCRRAALEAFAIGTWAVVSRFDARNIELPKTNMSRLGVSSMAHVLYKLRCIPKPYDVVRGKMVRKKDTGVYVDGKSVNAGQIIIPYGNIKIKTSKELLKVALASLIKKYLNRC